MQLDDDVRERILRGVSELRADRKLRSRDELAGYYANFRQRFGPDALAQLDGEALLTQIHDHGRRDSLVYWLEFKDDDELPAVFGSILGGSALKFGIYRRKETGAWMTGHAQEQRVLEIGEAVAIARRHRDQLVRGARLLDEQPRDPERVDYDALQTRMVEVAPDVAESAWGHKYFSLIAHELLDDYHAASYQAFHLLKMRQRPVDGRYRAAGIFAPLARALELPTNHLTISLNHVDGDPHRWIRIGTTEGDSGRSQWEAMRAGGYVAIGWNQLGDLSSLTYDAASRERVKQQLIESGSHPSAAGNAASQILDFVARTAPRDIVVAMHGAKRVVGIGRVTSDYVHAAREGEFAHRRPVEWLSLREWELPEAEPVPATYRNLKSHGNVIAIEREMGKAATTSVAAAPVRPEVRRAVPAPLTGTVGRIESALRRKGQVILYGPPGTGKTHHAEEASQELAARSFFGRSWSELSAAERGRLRDTRAGGLGAIETCCFHPAYGYEDFLEGYRPETAGTGLGFTRRDGVFKRLCERAAASPEREFFLLIDEINRGDVPRIFGELLTVLEKSRRGSVITLPLSGEAFAVPANVFVIATMNTADRSIALLDAALRRRFAFIELMPRADLLASAALRGVPLGPWLDSLNERIRQHVGRDGRNLQVGHSYLLEGGAPLRDFARFRAALRDDVLPLLEEYCYERPEALAAIVGTGLYDETRRRFRDELFDGGSDDALVQALLVPDPNVTATRAAVDAGATDEDDDDATPAA